MGKINPSGMNTPKGLIKDRPGIIIKSKKGDDSFNFESDGWFEIKKRNTVKAQELMKKAQKAIDEAKDHDEAIKLLKKAGFNVYK
mgnify:FL=1